MTRRIVLFAAVLATWSSATVRADDVSGAWQVTITTAAGKISGRASLEQVGDKVTGSIGPSEDATIRLEGVPSADKLTLKTYPRAGRTAAFETCTVTVGDEKLVGTVEGGDVGKGSIEFERDKRH